MCKQLSSHETSEIRINFFDEQNIVVAWNLPLISHASHEKKYDVCLLFLKLTLLPHGCSENFCYLPTVYIYAISFYPFCLFSCH